MSIRLNSMFKTIEFPASISDLSSTRKIINNSDKIMKMKGVPGLSNVDGDNFTHDGRRRVLKKII